MKANPKKVSLTKTIDLPMDINYAVIDADVEQDPNCVPEEGAVLGLFENEYWAEQFVNHCDIDARVWPVSKLGNF